MKLSEDEIAEAYAKYGVQLLGVELKENTHSLEEAILSTFEDPRLARGISTMPVLLAINSSSIKNLQELVKADNVVKLAYILDITRACAEETKKPANYKEIVRTISNYNSTIQRPEEQVVWARKDMEDFYRENFQQEDEFEIKWNIFTKIGYDKFLKNYTEYQREINKEVKEKEDREIEIAQIYAKFGIPLGIDSNGNESIDLETVILSVLENPPHRIFIENLPALLIKNYSNLDKERIEQTKNKSRLGYILDVTKDCMTELENPELDRIIENLKIRCAGIKPSENLSVWISEREFSQYSNLRPESPYEKRWNVVTGIDYATFLSHIHIKLICD